MSTTMHYALADGQAAVIQGIHAEYRRALGDCDKAGTVEDSAYYQGRVDALVGVLSVLGAFRENTCSVCHHGLLFTADGAWVSDSTWDACDPQPGKINVPHTPTFPVESSSAAETENAVFPTLLCEEDPMVENYCAYHRVWHAGREGDQI